MINFLRRLLSWFTAEDTVSVDNLRYYENHANTRGWEGPTVRGRFRAWRLW